jgi:hypothetical protein
MSPNTASVSESVVYPDCHRVALAVVLAHSTCRAAMETATETGEGDHDVQDRIRQTEQHAWLDLTT